MAKIKVHPIERFMAKVAVSNTCWEWQGAKASTGTRYGTLYVNGKLTPAHRFIYEHSYGPAGDKVVMHTCDNPGCVKLSHLRLGTHKENTVDAVNKGIFKKSIKDRNASGYCKNGHYFKDPRDRAFLKGKYLVCLICARERGRKHNTKRKEI